MAALLTLAVSVGSIIFLDMMIKQNDELLGDAGNEECDAYYVLVTEEADTDFWKNILKGALEKAAEDNIYLSVQQQALSETMTKQQQMEMAIHSGVDGILLDGGESPSLLNLVNQAASAGIPVVTMYHDCAPSSRISYVSISGTNMGRSYGEQICELVRESEKAASEKLDVMVLLDASDSTGAQNILLTGMREELEAGGMGELVELETTAIHSGSMFSAQEEIRRLFAERKPADIFVCLDELSTASVSQLVVDYNLVGSVQILGFYKSDAINSALEKQIISATIVADTYQMGRDGVEALNEYRQSGYVSEYYTSGISVLRAGYSAGQSVETEEGGGL